jgi:hypothetical protein
MSSSFLLAAIFPVGEKDTEERKDDDEGDEPCGCWLHGEVLLGREGE